MKTLLDRLRRGFRGLSSRERILVSSVGGLLGAGLLWFGALVPVFEASARTSGQVEIAQRQLELALRLRREFDEVQQRLGVVESGIQSAPRGNLRTTLEDLAKRAKVKIDSMEPQVSPASDRYRETKVEVGLKMLSLPETVRYLHEIESTDQMLSVKVLRIRARPDKSGLLDVTFTVSSFEPI